MKILIVDDDMIIQQVVSRHVSLLGHHVTTANNGLEALAAIEHQRFDIVITDLQMPMMDGHELITRLHDAQPMIRTIVMTSYVSMDQIMECLREGAFSFVTKPLGDCAALDRAIEHAGWVVNEWREQLRKLNRLKEGAVS
jgi:CheY-like chemotaxis protein